MTNRISAQRFWLVSALLILLPLSTAFAQNCTKYVDAATGKGKDATMTEPAKDLGNIISRLEPGDVVCIAAGEYTGRGERGVDVIETPVEIYGGFSPDFATRDPWGAHRTIFTGLHNSDNFETQTRLTVDTSDFATKLMEARGEETAHTVVVDGILFDNGPRNFYKGDEDAIIRQGTASDTPTPESGALTVRTGVNGTVRVENNIALNFAPTEGVFSFFGGKNADVTVRNNVAVNNTGAGFRLGTSFTGEEVPSYTFTNNISAFNQKHDPFGGIHGSGILLESSTAVSISNSVFIYNDQFGVDNAKRASNVVLTANLIAANGKADYLEFDLRIDLDDLEDESELLDDASGNDGESVVMNVSDTWGNKYASRNVIDRNEAEEDVQVVESWANDVRGFFNWNLQGTDLDADSAFWLPRLSIDEALAVATMYGGKYGVSKP